jgi:phosphomannomutase
MFDIDGTLTEPRQSMTKDFEEFFIKWMNDKKVFLVTGSDMAKVHEQIPVNIINKCYGIFASMANEFYYHGKLEYKNEIDIPEVLIGWLKQQVEFSPWSEKTSNHLEFRPGMLNFSVIGRNATKEQRDKYYEWDKQVLERTRIANYINNKFSELEACIGGQISIDIQTRGKNKAQSLQWIRKNYNESVYFFGDRCTVGGNDYAICQELDKPDSNGYYMNVEGPQQLKAHLDELED